MAERTAQAGEPTRPWCSGWARYWVEREHGKQLLVVAARCRIAGTGGEELALLDTGAQWTVIGGELAELARPHAEDMGYDTRMSTRHGTIDGRLHRVAIELVADTGNDLEISATALLAPDWPGPPVLGYRGLLERVRLGFDPGIAENEQWLCFGGGTSMT